MIQKPRSLILHPFEVRGLLDGRILDPTAEQLSKWGGEVMPSIYLGPRPDWYLDYKEDE